MEKRKKISKFPEYYIYNDGKVFSLKSNAFLKPILNNSGYLTVRLTGVNSVQKNFVVNKLVAEYFLNANDRTLWIKNVDGNKLNSYYTNLRYCAFKDLLTKDKRSKPFKKRIDRVPFDKIINAYKYYLQFIPEVELSAFIMTLKGRSENFIIRERWENKSKYSPDENIFIAFCSGKSYVELMKLFGISRRKISEAIGNTRVKLVAEITKDIEDGKLKYNPAVKVKRKLLTDKEALEKFSRMKTEYLSSL